MIFVTVGTTPFPFLRMRSLVKEIVENQKGKEEIVFQHGATPNAKHNAVKNYHTLSHPKMKEYMVKARVIVCHGGPATIYQALEAGKIPYVLPRKKEFGEHVDDHQTYFCSFMEEKRLVYVIRDVLDIHQVSGSAPRAKNDPSPALITYLSEIME